MITTRAVIRSAEFASVVALALVLTSCTDAPLASVSSATKERSESVAQCTRSVERAEPDAGTLSVPRVQRALNVQLPLGEARQSRRLEPDCGSASRTSVPICMSFGFPGTGTVGGDARLLAGFGATDWTRVEVRDPTARRVVQQHIVAFADDSWASAFDAGLETCRVTGADVMAMPGHTKVVSEGRSMWFYPTADRLMVMSTKGLRDGEGGDRLADELAVEAGIAAS